MPLHYLRLMNARFASSLAVATLLAQFPSPASAVNVTEGLIHLWRLDETVGTTAFDSIGSWNMQTVGGAALGSAGLFNSGASLDGTNDFLTTVAATTDFLASDFTLSMWLKFGTISGKPGLLQFIHPFPPGGNVSGTALDLGVDLKYPDLTHRSLAPVLEGYNLYMPGTAPMGDGQWHYFSVVREGASASMYVDNTLAGTGVGTINATGANVFELGKNDASHFFGGVIDDVAIYNRALSPSEIAANVAPEPTTRALLGITVAFVSARRHRRRDGVVPIGESIQQ